MSRRALNSVLQLLRDLVPSREGALLGDAALLESYVNKRDEAAFETLLQRHGPMVLGVCRRMLGDAHAVEDAFQVTFLVLLQKARSLRRQDLLGNWLYGVAYRTSLKARVMAARRRTREQCLDKAPEPAAAENTAPCDLRPIIDEEIRRLPDRYRQPIVLCCLEGKSITAAAAALGWPHGTVSGRLARAKERLRSRLTRRGITLSVGALGLALSENAHAAVPRGLLAATVQAAGFLAADQPGGAAALTPSVSLLFKGVMKIMFLTKLKFATAILLCIGAAGAGALAYSSVAGQPQEIQKPKRAPEVAQQNVREESQKSVEESFKIDPPLSKEEVRDWLRASNYSDRMQSLLERRHDAAATEFAARSRRYVEGKESLDIALGSALRLLEAEREISARKADQLAVLNKNLSRTKEIERITQLKFDAGSAALQDLAQAQFSRFQAEIWVERAKAP